MSLLVKKHLLAATLLASSALAQPSHATPDDDSAALLENEGTTIIYDQEFIAGFPNAVTVLDIITRIPGGSQILNSGGNGGNSRGFSNNDDRILIDGKRVAGKSNDGSDALERITIEQVDRIELIRGGNPDVKVSSQDAIINIVLREDASRNSGSYETTLRISTRGGVAIGGKASYGGSLGNFDYFLSFDRFANGDKGRQIDREFIGADVLERQLNETEISGFRRHSVTANLGYNFTNGDILRFNGKWELRDFGGRQPGTIFIPDSQGQLEFGGRSERLFESTRRPGQLEFSGDFEKALSDKFQFKALALYSKSEGQFVQAEDFEITGDTIEEDFRFISRDSSKEAIARSTLTWTPNQKHSLELGSELALNSLNSGLQLFNRENGVLVEQDVSGANIRIEETRNESFATHSWTLNQKFSIETSIFTEFSEIRQSGIGFRQSRTFFYLKPSTDIRYNISDLQQAQFSIRRRVSQLNFGDFASTVSNDDEVVGSNADLVPQKQWQIEGSYEYRLKDDGGSVKVGLRYDDFQDLIQRIETSPGVSGVGNVGSAKRYRFSLEGNLRLDFIGIEGGLIETDINLRNSRTRNPFTGEGTRFNNFRHVVTNLNYRHDLKDWGFSYGTGWRRRGRNLFQDIDEITIDKGPRDFIDVFVEAKLIGTLTARLEANNLLNVNFGRVRQVFNQGVASGSVSNTIERDFHQGSRIIFSIKGTF